MTEKVYTATSNFYYDDKHIQVGDVIAIEDRYLASRLMHNGKIVEGRPAPKVKPRNTSERELKTREK